MTVGEFIYLIANSLKLTVFELPGVLRMSEEPLFKAAYAFADEIREGRWDHVSARTLPLKIVYPTLLAELEKRCLGHSVEEYSQALARGLHASR